MSKMFEEATRFLQSADSLLVVSHINPDGDAICSTLAVAEICRIFGKEVTMVNASPVSSKYFFLPNAKKIGSLKDLNGEYSYVITVDAADRERVGEAANAFSEDVKILNIDHHVTNDHYGTVNVVVPTAAATVEILYHWIEYLQIPWSKELATWIYTGLLTDTGGFRYSNTTSDVLRIAAKLIDTGIHPHELAERALETLTISQIEVIRRGLAALQIAENGKVAWICLSKQELEDCKAEKGDLEGLVNYARNIDGVEVGIFFREVGDGEIKVSLRSKHSVDVSKIAGEFGGGGHMRAAGCTVFGTMEEVVNRVLARVQAEWESEAV